MFPRYDHQHGLLKDDLCIIVLMLTLLLPPFFLSRSTSSTNWICRFINFFGPLVGGGLTITNVCKVAPVRKAQDGTIAV